MSNNDIDTTVVDEIETLPVDQEARERRLALEETMNSNNIWGYSQLGLEAKQAAMRMLGTKNGLYARIPLICKSDSCPYSETCQLLKFGLAPLGEYCPNETAQIELRVSAYNEEFELEDSSFTDKALVTEIVNLDIMIERVRTLIAKIQDPVEQIYAGNTEAGDEFTRPEVSKYIDIYDRHTKKRNDMYQLMLATRKDKKGDNGPKDPLASLFEEVRTTDFVEEVRPEQFQDVEEVLEEE